MKHNYLGRAGTSYIHMGQNQAPGVVYIGSVVFYSSLHIHHQIVHTSHFHFFLGPHLVVVYIFGGPKMSSVPARNVACPASPHLHPSYGLHREADETYVSYGSKPSKDGKHGMICPIQCNQKYRMNVQFTLMRNHAIHVFYISLLFSIKASWTSCISLGS